MKRIACIVLLSWCCRAVCAQQSASPRPVHLEVKLGECESMLDKVEVAVSAVVDPKRATMAITCKDLEFSGDTWDIDPSNALAVAQLLRQASAQSLTGEPFAATNGDVTLDTFDRAGKNVVEVQYQKGDTVHRIWFDAYNAVSLSRLIVQGKQEADWLAPRLVQLQ